MDIQFKASSPDTSYQLTLHLHGAIRPDGCRFEAATANLLVVLCKAQPGIMWPSLESLPPPTSGRAGEEEEIRRSSSKPPAVKSTPAVAVPTFRNQVMFELD